MTFYCLMLNLPPKKEVVFSHQFYSTITHPLHHFSVSYHASPWFNSLIKAPGKSSFCYLRRSFVSPDQCISLASSWVITYCLQNHFNVSLPITSSPVCCPFLAITSSSRVTSITHSLRQTWVDTADISLRCISFYTVGEMRMSLCDCRFWCRPALVHCQPQ
jgi:hypothetical protein